MANSASASMSAPPADGPVSVVRTRPAARQGVRPTTAPTRAFERPPPPVQHTPDSDAQTESRDTLAEWAQPTPSTQPSWALHAVSVLQEGHRLPARIEHERTTEFKVWPGCSGISSEMFALRELAVQLRVLVGGIVKWILYSACDKDKLSRRFSDHNHDPRHVSSKMQHRNFEVGQYECEKHGASQDLPRAGVDFYMGTCPCSPWSRRGRRSSFAHPDAEVAIIGLKTIAYICPAVFVVEVGEMPCQHALGDLMETIQDILQSGAARWTFQMVRDMTPAFSGHPARRRRLFFIGWRVGTKASAAIQPLQPLIDRPLAV